MAPSHSPHQMMTSTSSSAGGPTTQISVIASPESRLSPSAIRGYRSICWCSTSYMYGAGPHLSPPSSLSTINPIQKCKLHHSASSCGMSGSMQAGLVCRSIYSSPDNGEIAIVGPNISGLQTDRGAAQSQADSWLHEACSYAPRNCRNSLLLSVKCSGGGGEGGGGPALPKEK